jgi:hypothetical protein
MTRVIGLLVALSVRSFLSAGTTSIGSVVSQGDLRIDDHPVAISGTIFNGSVIETGTGTLSSADVRLHGNVKLTFSGDSRVTLYSDHLVLLRGEAEVDAPGSFRTEVTGLTVSTSDSHTSGTILLGRDGVVNVSALTGSFRVAKAGGLVLAQVTSQKPLALSPAAGGEWRVGNGPEGDFGRDHFRCYVDDDDRDCRHHHHHASK